MKELTNFNEVHATLGKYMLADGMPIVWDIDNSQGNWIVDGVTGKKYLDLFSFFASNAIGHNHPKMVTDAIKKEMGELAVHNPTNSDIYTREMAQFVDTFMDVAVPDSFKHVFFVAGGALAVENALKAAFDWKVQKNFKNGYTSEKGHQVIHFRQAFHGRSGYTMSLTNTLEDKVKYFPKFSWPRIHNPKVSFPIASNLEKIEIEEQLAINQIKTAFKEQRDDIAAIIIEPIQGEGGDNHFRPEFFKELRKLADENEALLIFDEVQTGLGLTGAWWAFERLGTTPDLVSFGKKTQVCGFFAGPKIDEVENNVFNVSSRINSTWGGNLIDMVRSRHYIEIIKEDNLVENAKNTGEYLLKGIQEVAGDFPELIKNPRGMGLMCAFTLPNVILRDKLVSEIYNSGAMMLPCGPNSIRVRPALTLNKEEADIAVEKIREAIEKLQ